MLRGWMLAGLLLSFPPIFLSESRGEPPTEEVADRGQVDRLIQQLGGENFDEREAASQQLKKIGPPALATLRATAKDSKDAETRRRAAEAVTVIENSLEQLLIDYRSYGLPMPPKDAPLVRCEWGRTEIVDGKPYRSEMLAFLIKPGSPTEPRMFLQGTYEWLEESNPRVQVVKPDPDVLKVVSVSTDGLNVAIQCHARGWDKLAEYLLERERTESRQTPCAALIETAWYYWERRLMEPKVDREPIAKHLRELIRRDKDLDTEKNRALLKSLELALVSSKAKRGSVEAIIDGLLDFDSSTWGWSGERKDDNPYWRLVDLGLDAVPALIEHLDDGRLSRRIEPGFRQWPRLRILLVCEVASDQLA